MLYLRVEFLLVVSFTLGVRGQCPAQCRCPSSYVANCASLALTKVPTDRFDRYVQNLDISDNDLVSLDKTSLRDIGAVSLVQVNASRNHISDIHEEAFLGQSKLQAVDLSSNSLTYIEPKAFMRNPSLERLSLSNNQNLRLPEGGPFLYSKSLRVLELSNCDLSHIPPDTFQKLPDLQELHISHNKIEILNPLQSVWRLKLLDVGHNYLTDLQPGIFTTSPELRQLNLSYNRLTILNITVMPQLTNANGSVDLSGNPWVCDCVMFSTVYSWCHNKSVDLGLVCSSPPEFKDKPWTVYDEAGCDSNVTKQVEETTIIHPKLLSSPKHVKYENLKASDSLTTQFQEQPVDYNSLYMYASLSLTAMLLSSITVMTILFRRLKSRLSLRTGPAQSDSEIYHLSDMEV